ncbi:hypothetical protein MMC26_005729 [Xylographa opegraphella]|nr:hypothetical protein [Xylographa opegraphella]
MSGPTDFQTGHQVEQATQKGARKVASQQAHGQTKESGLQEPAGFGQRAVAQQDIEGYQEPGAIKACPEVAVTPVPRTPHSSPSSEIQRREPAAPIQGAVDGVDQIHQDTNTAYRCPQCSFPCWVCNSATSLQQPVPPIEENIEEAIEENRFMEAISEATRTTETSKSKRKRADGRTYLGPKDEHFQSYILELANVQIRESPVQSKPGDILPQEQLREKPSSEVYLDIPNDTALIISDQLIISHLRK